MYAGDRIIGTFFFRHSRVAEITEKYVHEME